MKLIILKKHRQLFLFLVTHFLALGFAQNQKILFSFEQGNKMHRDFLKKTKMDSIYIFYQDEFVKNNALVFDQKLLEKSIQKRIPDKNTKGFAILDWEGAATKILLGIKSVDRKTYYKVVDNYVASIIFAKKLRPYIKWSFYNFQPIIYGKVHPGYDKLVKENYLKILQNIDFLTPSLYILDDRTEKNDQFSYDYGRSNAEYAIKLGLELKKPVYPFVWHRYSDHSKKSNHGLIELDHFEKFVSGVLSASYQGRKVDGVIWWECESFIANNLNLLPIPKREYKNVMDRNKHQNIILSYYYNRIIRNINKL